MHSRGPTGIAHPVGGELRRVHKQGELHEVDSALDGLGITPASVRCILRGMSADACEFVPLGRPGTLRTPNSLAVFTAAAFGTTALFSSRPRSSSLAAWATVALAVSVTAAPAGPPVPSVCDATAGQSAPTAGLLEAAPCAQLGMVVETIDISDDDSTGHGLDVAVGVHAAASSSGDPYDEHFAELFAEQSVELTFRYGEEWIHSSAHHNTATLLEVFLATVPPGDCAVGAFLNEDGYLLDPGALAITVAAAPILFCEGPPGPPGRLVCGDLRHVEEMEALLRVACLADLRVFALHIGACATGPSASVLGSCVARIRGFLAAGSASGGTTSPSPSEESPPPFVGGPAALNLFGPEPRALGKSASDSHGKL